MIELRNFLPIKLMAVVLLPFVFYTCTDHRINVHSYSDCVEPDFLADSGPKECLYIVVHTSENRVPTKITKKNGKQYFRNVAEDRGFPTGSYHFAAYENGEVDTLAYLNNNSKIEYFEKTCGVAGYNSRSVHIVYVGGLNRLRRCADTRTPEQQHSLLKLCLNLKAQFPKAEIVGHTELNPQKPCPCFNTSKWLQSLQL